MPDRELGLPVRARLANRTEQTFVNASRCRGRQRDGAAGGRVDGNASTPPTAYRLLTANARRLTPPNPP